MKHIAVFFFLICLSFTSYSQQYLALKKNSKIKIYFEEGDKIKFKLKGEKFYNNHRIIGFGLNKIKFHYFDIALNEIEAIKLVEKKASSFNHSSVAGKLFVVGVGYLLIDQFNQSVINNGNISVSNSTALVAASFISAGIFIKLLKKKKFNLTGRKYHLEIVDYMP